MFHRCIGKFRSLTIIAIVSINSAALAQQPAQDLPWPMQLGLRAHEADLRFPLIDRVVLVPDAATYLDELTHWSPAGRWPVLIEDDHFAPMFIRAFAPAEVIRREASPPLATEGEGQQKLIESIIINAWGGLPGVNSVPETFEQNQFTPAGVIVASVRDSAWPAAVALAAARGQPIVWLDESFRRPDQVLSNEHYLRLRDAIESRLTALHYRVYTAGDDIDAITICLTMAGKADAELSPAARARLSPDLKAEPPFAITDLIGRNENGDRFALTGWIFGDETRTAYVAMCSLFLARERIEIVHTYPNDPTWRPFDAEPAVTAMREAGFIVSYASGPSADLPAWRQRIARGLDTDLLVMTTKGNPDFFDLARGRASAYDIPLLQRPIALTFIHSWSLRFPERPDTIGARWLDHGVYAYIGSVHEPYVHGFVPPVEEMGRWLGATTFAGAGRVYPPHPLAQPWKIQFIGDPLMLCPPPARHVRERITIESARGTSVQEHAKALMKACASGGDANTYNEAISNLILLGRDDAAAQLWRHAEQAGVGPQTSRAALAALFRRGREDDFLRAWMSNPPQDDRSRDMLWHMLGPTIPSIRDESVLLELRGAIRRPNAHYDIERLAGPLARAFGREHVRAFILGEIERTDSEYQKRKLQELLQPY